MSNQYVADVCRLMRLDSERYDRGCGKGKVGRGGKCVPAKFNKAKAFEKAGKVLGHVGTAAAILSSGLKIRRLVKDIEEENARKQKSAQQHE